MVIIVPLDEKEIEKGRILHGLIKGKLVYRSEEKERKNTPMPIKMTKDGFVDPLEIIKGRYLLNDKKISLKLK